ncbi:MAG: hypothetical protein QHH04_02145 [Methanolinea sp.]|nr:hypothetical protein [Methanolinea sp.]
MGKRTLLPVLLAAALLLAGAGCLDILPWAHPPVVYPSIVPVQGGSMPRPPVFRFPFQDFSVTIDVPVDPAVYAGARNADKGARVYDQDVTEDEWRAGIYRALMEDPAQEGFFSDLLSALRHVRDTRALDSDEYAELLAVFVQSIPYETQQSSDPRFPVEVCVDGAGDCDDKSLLLASLLAREGYRAALLYFGPEAHMAVGVGCSGPGYRQTGYAYIETTNVTFVGVPPRELADGVRLESFPTVIPVGSGTLTYTRCPETGALSRAMDKMRDEADSLGVRIHELEGALLQKKAELDATREEMEGMRRHGNVAGYNSLVARYNAGVTEYNSMRSRLSGTVTRYNRLVDAYNTLSSHQFDRKGMYAWLASTGDLSDTPGNLPA